MAPLLDISRENRENEGPGSANLPGTPKSTGTCDREVREVRSRLSRVRSSILEMPPEERLRVLGEPERLGRLPRQMRQTSLGPPQRLRAQTVGPKGAQARAQTPRRDDRKGRQPVS
ncbi:unnamed protein product [Effrenium voratum]|nr:unnamed protein product [Effrenium voratum]